MKQHLGVPRRVERPVPGGPGPSSPGRGAPPPGAPEPPRLLQAYVGPDGELYLPEGTVLQDGEQILVEPGDEDAMTEQVSPGGGGRAKVRACDARIREMSSCVCVSVRACMCVRVCECM